MFFPDFNRVQKRLDMYCIVSDIIIIITIILYYSSRTYTFQEIRNNVNNIIAQTDIHQNISLQIIEK